MTTNDMACLRELRERDVLTPEEESQLHELLAQADAEESKLLLSANVQHEAERLEAQNRHLRVLIERKAALVARLRVALDEAAAERRAIEDEISRVLRPVSTSASTAPSISRVGRS